MFLLSLLLSAWLCWRFSQPHSLFYWLDQPVERSLHQQAVPRTGGIALFIAIALAWLFYIPLSHPLSQAFWPNAFLLALVGLWDDRYSISPIWRLLVQSWVAINLLQQNLLWPLLPIQIVNAMMSLIFILWWINLYNFMDGMDGLAASMSIIGFSSIAYLSYGQDMALFQAALAVVAASLGFLIFNFHPARIFMGDMGSTLLGFLVALFLLYGQGQGLFSMWSGILIFLPFIIDASYTLLYRLFKGEKIWLPHKQHGYQLAVQAGYGQKKVLFFFILYALLSASAAILLEQQADLLKIMAILLGFLIYIIGRRKLSVQ